MADAKSEARILNGNRFSGVGVSYRPEFQPFWKDVFELIDCVEFIPDELPDNPLLFAQTLAAIGTKPCMAHSTSLSVASPEPLAGERLAALKGVIERIGADCCSDHLSFRRAGDMEIENFCLPLTDRLSIEVILQNLERYSDAFARRIALENITINGLTRFGANLGEELYLFQHLAGSGVGVLFDVNNCFINCKNFGVDPTEYLSQFPLTAIEGIHIAGHETSENWVVDSHMAAICPEVYDLLDEVLACSAARYVVLERDNNSCTAEELVHELAQIRQVWARRRH
ncbi:MAG: DUF692 family multinuclear iron-containing protein [Rhizobiaceae bacterium]